MTAARGQPHEKRAFVFNPSFDVVLARAQNGNKKAFEQIFQAASQRVSAFARVRGAEDPEGITNEVYLKVFKNLTLFVGNEAQFYGWIFTIARNRLIDERRRSDRRPKLTLVQTDVDRPSGDVVDEQALERVTTSDLVERLEGLTDDQRDVLLLRLVADLTIESIAETLDKNIGAVKALQRRALRAIAANISDTGVPL